MLALERDAFSLYIKGFAILTMTRQKKYQVILHMSTRPQRQVNPIQTLANNQGRNAAAVAARRAKPQTVGPKTMGEKRKRSPEAAVVNIARINVLPIGKGTLIPLLKILISQVTNDKDLQQFLISMYDETANNQYTVDLFGGKTKEEAKQRIAVHIDLFSKNLYRGSTPQMSFNMKGDDMINLAYLMYLDMLHDTTIKKNMTFKTFCKESIQVSVKVPAPTEKDKKKTKMVKKIQKSPVYILFGKELKAKETDYIKLVNAFIAESGGKAELAVKNNLPSIYPGFLERDVTIRKDQVTPSILTPGHNMFLSVDQEDEKATVTLDIQRTKYTLPNGTEGKIMYPLVSVANLMDPGKNMLIESAKEDSKYFMLGLNNKDIRSRLTWNYKQPNFTINHDNGGTTIGAYYTDAARVNNDNRNTTTKRGYAYKIKNNSGEYRFASSVSKAKAKDGSTGDKVAKFLGDFLQALTVVSYIKGNTNNKYHYCLATGDAMLANNFIFLCSRSGVSPNLWMATSTQQVSKVYGKMIDQIQTVRPAPTLVRNAPENINGNQTESSGNKRVRTSPQSQTPPVKGARINRKEGGGNSNGIMSMNFGRATSVSRNSTSPKKPKTPNRNNGGNVPMGNASNPTSVTGSSPGSVSRKNIMSQPSAKRVKLSLNTRNKLIVNLKKKNLPNYVIKGLIGNYDNKNKTANQVIREANNVGKTLAMGKTAQRMNTLRPRL